MKKILILEANSNQALAIAKYIKKYSSYYVIGATEKSTRFNRSFFDKVIVEKFLEIDITEYDFILPMGANSTYSITSAYDKFSYFNSFSFVVDNLLVYDKPKMLAIANELNVPIPKTFYKRDNIENFPVFYKENFENGGGVRGIANTQDEIPTYNSLIYQEYIDTPSTYGVGFLAKGGKITTYYIHKETTSYPIVGGSAVAIEEFKDERLIRYTKSLVDKLNYNGWGLSEYKYCDKRDDFIFMEINGKFWASIEFMLRNNNQFLLQLLNIEYSNKRLKKALFINRFIQYSFLDILKNSLYLRYIPYIKESSILYQITRKIIPKKFVNFLKGRI